jgi:hydrogenase maturation factor
MCMSQHLKVTSVTGNKAVMEDGRIVMLGPVGDASSGDYLEVHANIAIAKSSPDQVKEIRASRTEETV